MLRGVWSAADRGRPLTSSCPSAAARATYASITCACGCAIVFAIDVELAVETRLATRLLVCAALGAGWLLYPQVGTWSCPPCMASSDQGSEAFTWAVDGRAKYLRRGLEL